MLKKFGSLGFFSGVVRDVIHAGDVAGASNGYSPRSEETWFSIEWVTHAMSPAGGPGACAHQPHKVSVPVYVAAQIH